MTTAKIVVLISGGGTNLQALIDACKSERLLGAQIVKVVSNRKSAFGLKRAEQANIPTCCHNLLAFRKEHPHLNTTQSRDLYDQALATLVLGAGPHLVVCAGWMHILGMRFLGPLAEADIPVINLHPALPGHFSGAGAIERAYEAYKLGKVQSTGVMVHHVIPEVDLGTPILVRAVNIRPGDTLSDLEDRIHSVEHELTVEATDKILQQIRPRLEETPDP